MKKIFTLAAIAALVLSACAKVETEKVIVEDEPIGFGVYVPQATKAGDAGTITTDGANSTVSLQTVGFGVFATYSDGGNYAATIGPNFMYNTKVSTAAWTYSPVKYWPNETIDDHNGASGPAAADKLSFFAYAPHVAATPGTGAVSPNTEGITTLTTNEATTDPKVSYTVATDPTKSVDLLWAVAPASFTYTDVHNTTVSVTEGMPLINLTKPAHDYVIRFNFKHATSRLGLKIIGAFDQVAEGGTLDSKTKVTVKEIKLVDVPVYTTGVLNLNNTTAGAGKPNWELPAASTATFTVDGDKLNSTIKDSGTDAVQTVEGVTASEKNVFASNNSFFTLIPKTGSTNVDVQITYYVTTEDADLKGGKSRVENVITKTVTFANGFAAGKANTIKITLGLTSVKLEAVVENWDVIAATNVDLPINS